jgi:rRNA maturation RNase YbeY
VRIAVRGVPPCDLALAKRAMREVGRTFSVPAFEVTLAFVDDDQMRELNGRYRGKDRTTDVLSFGEALPSGVRGHEALSHIAAGPDGVASLGDVVVSGAVAARQARRRRWPLASEVAFLAAHGLLHLLGYEDETPKGYREMLALGREAVSVARRRKAKVRAPER